MRLAAMSVCVIVFSVVLLADDQHIETDDDFDYSRIKTFNIRTGKINNSRPELNNQIVTGKIREVVRTVLASKGLKESSDRPDMFVDFEVDGVDWSVGPFGRASPIPNRGGEPGRGGRGQRAAPNPPPSSDRVDFTEGTLVIDFTVAPATLIWRGVYRDNEKNSSNFAQKLPDDAKKLLVEYPPKRKK
jgi:hypothetical protein